MSRSPKTVTFKVPVEAPSPRKESVAPAPSSKPPTPSPLTLQTHESSKDSQLERVSLSPAPDLVADIINRPKTVYPSKVPTNSPVPSTKQQPSSASSSADIKQLNKRLQSPNNTKGVPSYVRLAHRRLDHSRGGVTSSSTPTRDGSPLFSHQEKSRISKSSTAAIAREVRDRTNSESHEHVRSLKQDVSQLREHLLKVEEEIKNLSRGRNTLEIAVQDIRKALSVNQQFISTQQKKSSRGEEDSSIKLLREESRVLSKAKRSVEQHLQVVKSHLQLLDTTRRNLKTKISTMSSSLDLDAQNFKVYDGPISVRLDSVSRQRQYASGYQALKNNRTGDEAAKLCTATVDVMNASRAVRGDIKALVISVQASKTDAHKKIADSISRNIQDARTRKKEILLERGQTRMAQNSTLHQIHEEEIALGIALGPVSEKHRSVSEKIERPLSQLRPASATEERENFKQTRRDLTRRLSASSVRASQVNNIDRHLAVQLREGRQADTLDSQTLRIRKMSLDNRWVQ